MDAFRSTGSINSVVFPKKPLGKKINFSIGEIGDLELKVKNIEKACEFYQEKLGITVINADSKSAMCDCNGMRFMLTKSEKYSARSVLYLKVDDIHATHALLTQRGIQFYDSPKSVVHIPGYELWQAFFRDLDNNLLSLISENLIPEMVAYSF